MVLFKYIPPSYKSSFSVVVVRTIHSLSVVFGGTFKVSKSRRKKSNPASLSDEELREGCHLGMDSHADMSCVGAHAIILETYEGQVCNVMPFNDGYEPMKNVQTVNAAFAYDSEDGRTYIL